MPRQLRIGTERNGVRTGSVNGFVLSCRLFALRAAVGSCGPDACNWLTNVPVLPVTAAISTSDNVVRVSWGAIPRSEYQAQYVTNLASAFTNNWLDFTNGRVLATEKPTSLVVATSNSQSKVFFRIQSLGRTPGN